jgi:4-amino-4-deoxy-L-arabinose transferase-like glycosyltransferase
MARLASRFGLVRADWLACVMLAAWMALRLLPGLDHPGMPRWDEALHQSAARGTFEEPLRPHIYRDHLHPRGLGDWIYAGVWLHKPPLPFWAGALLMHLTGIQPLALRWVSVLADLAVGLGLFFMLRRRVGRFWATLAGFAYLSLNFTWMLTQGFQFGDVTDTTLAAFVTLATIALVRACERPSARWACAAGLFLAMGYLCKSALALTPLAVAIILWALHRRRLAWGLRPRPLLVLVGSFAVAALPWAFYSARAWPEQYRANAKLIFAHLVDDWYPWGRPIDALLNEINGVELFPIPVALPMVAAVWVAWRAWQGRRSLDLALALWIWISWIVLSLTPAKVPAHGFGAVPAILAAVVLLVVDVRSRPLLAAATLATAVSGWVMPWLPSLSKVRTLVPATLPQTRDRAGMAEGLFLALLAVGVSWLVVRCWRDSRWPARILGWAATLAVVGLLGVHTPIAKRADRKLLLATTGATDYTREVGRALDRAVPDKSVVFLDTERNPECCSQEHALIFYSGKMTYRGQPEIETSREQGYAPYLVSPQAVPYAPVPGIPAHAWWRAYDLSAPLAAPVGIPEGVTSLSARAGQLELLGIARGPAISTRDRWALVARVIDTPADPAITLVFETRRGTELVRADLRDVLMDLNALKRAPWFILPFIGPLRAEVSTLRLEDGTSLALPPGS